MKKETNSLVENQYPRIQGDWEVASLLRQRSAKMSGKGKRELAKNLIISTRRSPEGREVTFVVETPSWVDLEGFTIQGPGEARISKAWETQWLAEGSRTKKGAHVGHGQRK